MPTTPQRPAPPCWLLSFVVCLLSACVITEASTAQLSPPSSLDFSVQARRLGGLKAQVATLLVQGGQAGALAVEVLAAPASVGGEMRRIPVLIEIEGPTLLSVPASDEGEEPPATMVLEVYAYALSPQGGVKGFFTQRLRLALEAFEERIFEGGVKFVGILELPPGEYSLRVLVREPASDRFALRTLPLTVPAGVAPGPRLLMPLLAEPPGRWVLARQDVSVEEKPSTEGEERVETEPPVPPDVVVRPLLLGPEAALPAAFPVLDAGEVVELHLLAQGLGDSPTVTARLSAEVEAGGKAAAPVRVVGRMATEVPGVERLGATFEVPELATGVYRLTFAAAGEESPPLRAIVLARNPTGERLVWGQIRSIAASLRQAPEEPTGRAPLPKRRKKRESALARLARERYRAALERAAISREDGLEAIASFERELLAEGVVETLDALLTAEPAVAAELAAVDPEALLPLVLFHLELYQRYRQEGTFVLASHARTMARLLIERYVDQASGEGPPRLAARALTLLAREMFDAGLRTVAGEALERALELEPGNEGAQLLLAAHYEKSADYRRAVSALERLVELRPKSAEGRLRLAVNLLRVGDESRSERVLAQMLAEANPPWTLTVAYIELATFYLDHDRGGQAISLLRQALDRLPSQGRLYVLLAFALDRQRLFHEARQVLDRLPSPVQNGGASPRHHYALWPDQGLAEGQRLLEEGTMARQPLLAHALKESAKAGGKD